MNRDMWLGLIRHLLTAVGGFFVAKGTVDADTMNTAIGAGVTLGGAVWSVIDKRK